MGRTAWTIAGAVVGAYFGSWQAGAMIGGAIGGVVDPERITGPRIGETSAQTSQEGAPRPIIYGTAPVFGNVISCGVVVHQEVETEGEKGGGPITSEDHVYRTYAIRICEGPIAGILRVWEDEKLVYDIRPGSLMLEASVAWMFGCNLYLGDETQLPDTFLQILVSGIGETPAYRGTAYMVFVGRDLTDRRGSLPQYRFEVAQAITGVDLEVIPSLNLQVGGGGGGIFDFEQGYNTSNFLNHSGAPGSVFRVNFHFVGTYAGGGSIAGGSVRIFIKLNDAEIWSSVLTIDTLGTADGYVQLNHVSDGTNLTVGFVANADGYYGDFSIQTFTLSSDEVFTAFNNGAEPPATMVPEDPYFGVVIGEDGRPCSAGATSDGASGFIPWGPPTFGQLTGDPVPLSTIVADLHARAGVDASKFDVSELTDMVAGLVLAGDYTAADAINTLRAPYFFDRYEADRQIRYPKRGAAVVTTITIDDLVEEPDESERRQAIEYPKKLHLAYQHAASGYAAVKATYARSSPDARVVGEVTTQVPVVFDEDQAAQIVHKMFKVAYAEAQGEVTLSVPESFLWITPTDTVGLALRGAVSRLRIDKADHADGVLKWTLKHDRQSAYTSVLTGVPIPAQTLPPSSLTGATVLAVMDIGSRVDSEDDLHILYAVTGGLPGWYGAQVQRSLDGGATYANAASIGRASVMGSLVDAVPTASEWYTDTTNTVRVQLYRDTQTIEDLTAAQFLSEGGAFALEKADGSFEVMQYRDATEDSSGQFLLSVLHRGLLNSAPSAHLAGALFVMLDRASHVAAESAWIGQALTHRAPSFEQAAELAAEQTETYVGRSQIEWPVAYLTTARDGADVITATWTPRHRFGSDDAPVASSNFQGYRVTLDDGVLAPVTFDSTPASFTYDASALGSPLTVSVSAINRITGAGPATSGSV